MHPVDALVRGRSCRGDTSFATHEAAERLFSDWRRELERLFGRPKLDFTSSSVSIVDWGFHMHEQRVHLRLSVGGAVASWRLQLHPIIRKDFGAN